MKRILLTVISAFISAVCAFAAPEWGANMEASELGLLGKAFDTPNPYHRVDTSEYKGFTPSENGQCRVPAGLTVAFRTDAAAIGVSAEFGNVRAGGYTSYMGFDLYIKKDGKWLWAGTTHFPSSHNSPGDIKTIVENMAPGQKECLVYLPIYGELEGCRIWVNKGATIEKEESPFRSRIVFHGSSFTQGISCTRSGMSYPMQFMRRTGLQVIPMGFSGNCKMQPYFADVMEDIDADAFVFDSFSNPDVPTIKERLEEFVDRMVKAHPGKPIIFQRTITWANENFNLGAKNEFGGKRELSDSLMPIICKRYKDVYYIRPDASLHNGESSTADGTHPNDNGYSCWERSIEKPILKILRKYGIR